MALGGLYGFVGKMMPGAKKTAFAAGKSAFKAAPSGAKKAAGQLAMKNTYRQLGKKPTRIAMGVGVLGSYTAAKPNANQSRTSYRGPMQTGRGVGRYS
ncbi:MAG: hypothetical protein RL176_614 [Pseudomonadota bacterium]|jgi:hypothetical protein